MYASKQVKPERRSVTVIFGDIKGFTSLSEFLDPEDLQELIDEIFKEFKEIIERNGGYLDKFIGDAVMAVFGAPVAHGDDPRRAVATAMAMQKYLEEVNAKRGVDIKMRIGINTGEVLWSSIAGEKPTVLGDTVNVAQRIEELAEPGKIYVTEAMVNLTFQFFFFREFGQVKVKGREEPIRVFEVLGEKPVESEFSIRGRFKTPFSGRKEELESVSRWLRGAFKNSGIYFVNIYGEAGIGKTRFCAELRNNIATELENVKQTYLRCDPIKQTPLYGFRKVVEDIFTIVTEGVLDSESISRYLESMHNFSKNDADLLSSRILSVLSGEVRFSPEILKDVEAQMSWIVEVLLKDLRRVVVFLDDAQFLDRESRKFFLGFREKIQSGSMIFVFVSRESMEAIPFDYLIELTGMGEGFVRDVCRTILQMAQEDVSQEFVETLLSKTRGNPYFIEELVFFLRDKDLLQYGPLRLKAEEFHLPETISSLLVESIDSLPEREKDVLKAASVIGKHFWKGILVKILNRSVEEDLNILEKEGFIISQGSTFIEGDFEYIFKNELLKDAVYSLLTRRERERLHGLVAHELERVKTKDEHLLYLVGFHFENSGDEEKALEYYEKAGDLAFSKGFYGYALRAYRNLGMNEEVAYKIAQCLEGLGEYDSALEILYANMEGLQENSAIKLKYEILVSSIYEKQSRFEEAFKYLEEPAKSADPELQAYAGYKKAWVYWRLGDYKNALHFAQLSIKAIENAGLSSRESLKTLGADFNLLGNIEQINGNFSSALAYYEKAMSIFEELGELISRAKILINASQIYLGNWDLDGAEESLNQALAIVKKSGSRFLLAVVLNNLGRVFVNRRKINEARQHYEEAMRIFKDLKSPDYYSEASINLAGIYLELHEFDKAESLLDEVMLSASELAPSRLGIAYLLRGIIAYKRMEFDQAIDMLTRAEEIFLKLNNPGRVLQARVYIAVVRGLKGDCQITEKIIKEVKEYSSSEQGLRYVESLINAGMLEYLCNGKVSFLEPNKLLQWLDLIINASLEIRLSWLTLFTLQGGERSSELSSLLQEENLKLICSIDVFPKIPDAKARGYLFGMLREQGAHLLLGVLRVINKNLD